MIRPTHKSRSWRRIFKKLPAGRVVTRYLKRKPGKAKCASCHSELHGVPRELPYKLKRLAKTEKRPERPYGGNLCSKCMREKIRLEARLNH